MFKCNADGGEVIKVFETECGFTYSLCLNCWSAFYGFKPDTDLHIADTARGLTYEDEFRSWLNFKGAQIILPNLEGEQDE